MWRARREACEARRARRAVRKRVACEGRGARGARRARQETREARGVRQGGAPLALTLTLTAAAWECEAAGPPQWCVAERGRDVWSMSARSGALSSPPAKEMGRQEEGYWAA